MLRTLAVAYAENHQFAEAIAAAERAIQLAQAAEDRALADDIGRYLEVFRSGKNLARVAPAVIYARKRPDSSG